VLLDLLEADGARFDRTIGLGDAWNDADLLREVGEPIIVPRPSGAPDPDLVRAVPAARVAPAPGARGWNLAVLDALAQSA
jgi:phosphoserine phosphatase